MCQLKDRDNKSSLEIQTDDWFIQNLPEQILVGVPMENEEIIGRDDNIMGLVRRRKVPTHDKTKRVKTMLEVKLRKSITVKPLEWFLDVMGGKDEPKPVEIQQ